MFAGGRGSRRVYPNADTTRVERIHDREDRITNAPFRRVDVEHGWRADEWQLEENTWHTDQFVFAQLFHAVLRGDEINLVPKTILHTDEDKDVGGYGKAKDLARHI
jgi:hypothetical protein